MHPEIKARTWPYYVAAFIQHGIYFLGLVILTLFLSICAIVGSIGFILFIPFALIEEGWQVGRAVKTRIIHLINKRYGP